jgi:phosphohistidine phosphatase SixA
MGTLYLVRHGQASFGAEDYDRLSDLGRRQCAQLGSWMKGRGLAFEAVLRGSLRRHRESLEALAGELPGLPEALEWPGLNEYDSEAVIAAIHPHPLAKPDTPELYRHHFRLQLPSLSW